MGIRFGDVQAARSLAPTRRASQPRRRLQAQFKPAVTIRLYRIVILSRANEGSQRPDSSRGADYPPRFFAAEGRSPCSPEGAALQFANLFVLEGEDPRETVAVRLSL